MRLLTGRDRRLLIFTVAIQMGTSLLDLIGVILVGLVGAMAVTTVQSQPPPSAVEFVVDAVGLQDLSDQQLVLVLAGVAAAALLGKSIVSSILTRRVFAFLANRQALVSARLTRELLTRPLTFVQMRSSQETAFALTGGAGAATMQILGQTAIAASEIALLGVLGVAVLVISPAVAVGSILFLAGVAFVLQRAMGNWAARVGSATATADIASTAAIQEAVAAYREISVSDRRSMYVAKIQDLRWQAARFAADTQFIAMVPKYIFEAALVLGGFALAGFLFSTQNAVSAVGTLALFLAAGSRVMPSVLRLQGASLDLRRSAGLASPTFELADDLANPLADGHIAIVPAEIREIVRRGYPDFEPAIRINGITVNYPGEPNPALKDVSLSVNAGTSVALVGRSGAGKTSLADVILGVLVPDTGSVSIGGLAPQDAISSYPGGIAYVPQDVVLSNDTIRANVALGLPTEAIEDQLVWDALASAHLADFLSQSREGLDTLVGERGVRLSGGQRQRLGIARALYTRPKLLVLDEATSALDAETERAITEMVDSLADDVTVVFVAHRLSTVRHVDQVVYLEQGSVAATGSFDEVRSRVPALKTQAELMGLS